MDELPSVLERLPDDDQFITRGEFRRLIQIFEPRLSKIERFCFEDEYDGDRLVRPSLASFLEKADTHIKVMCDYARAIKWLMIGITALGGLVLMLQQLNLVPIFHPFF